MPVRLHHIVIGTHDLPGLARFWRSAHAGPTSARAGEESWTVLADPEGNGFCVVRPKDTLIGQEAA